ncbi:MAG: putative toxin-antitoxin system toxin component, PIN family [Burkholderiales bacterium]|nr:putative toxin-antitoxin system toxin component, PIN family [Burkholderiales bacterium]
MRLVLDTNTALSGLLWGGTPGRLIDAAEAGQVELASSAALLAELQGELSREKFARQLAKRGLTVADVFDCHAALDPHAFQPPAGGPAAPSLAAGLTDVDVHGAAHAVGGDRGRRCRAPHGPRPEGAPGQ